MVVPAWRKKVAPIYSSSLPVDVQITANMDPHSGLGTAASRLLRVRPSLLLPSPTGILDSSESGSAALR